MPKMLIFWFVISLSLTFSFAENLKNYDDNVEEFVWEGKIREILKNLSTALKPKDPYVFSKLDLKLDNNYIRADLQVKDVIVRGFSIFEPTNIRNVMTIRPFGFKSKFNIKFDQLNVVVPYYNLDGLAVFVPLYGKGAVNLAVNDVHGGIEAQVIIKRSGAFILKKLHLKLNITQTNLFIRGIIHNEPFSEIVSTSTTECFSEFINLYNDRLGKILGDMLIEPINNILNPKFKSDEMEDFERIVQNNLQYDIPKIS